MQVMPELYIVRMTVVAPYGLARMEPISSLMLLSENDGEFQ
ncbi:MAG: hypothetical protein QXT53_05650 [Ignisphaera sp.]